MILSIGEILVDMIGSSNNGVMNFERHAGGAPFNVACGINKLGGEVGFIGNVGNDLNGKYLLDVAKKMNFKYLDVTLDDIHNTTIAFVANNQDGERSFCFNRNFTADYYFNNNSLEKIKDADIVNLGSLMLSKVEGIESADKIVSLVKKYNKLLSFDINFRDDIYKSTKDAIDISLKYIKEANILKFSEDEVRLLSNTSNLEEGINKLVNKNQIAFVTLGKEGSMCFYKDIKIHMPTEKVKAVDTTGAGDAFFSAVLTLLAKYSLDNLDEEKIKVILSKANKCGALACTKKGAIDSLEALKNIEEL